MLTLEPHISGACSAKRGLPVGQQLRVFQFSMQVLPLSMADLRWGRLRSTGGTDINCVLRHALDRPGLRTAVIITDGDVGTPAADLAAGIGRQGINLHALLLGGDARREFLQPLCTSISEWAGFAP